MRRLFDYKCLKCGQWTEAEVETEIVPEAIYCDCGGTAQRRWRKAPGMVADPPYYSEQLKTQFSSTREFEKFCKAKNLEVVSPREFKNDFKFEGSTKEADEKKDAQLTEACEKAYQQVIIGGQSRPKMPEVEIGSDDLEVA